MVGAGGHPPRAVWEGSFFHVLETHSYPRAVPLKREVVAGGHGVIAASFAPGSGEGQRTGRVL
jgi:hypothetical protein